MTLTNNQEVRLEDETEVIANLLRKGWIENEPPSHDPATQQAPTWDGAQWTIASRPSAELIAEAKTAKRAAMAAAFDALPLATQAMLYNTRITAELAMDRDRFDIAKAIVEGQAVPTELESTKAAILAYFD